MCFHSKMVMIEWDTLNISFSKVEIKGYNFIIDGRSVFGQPFKNDFRTYKNIRKNSIGQRDDFPLVAYLLIHILKEMQINSYKCKQITST